MSSSSLKKKQDGQETNQKLPSLIHLSLEQKIRMVHYFGHFNTIKEMQRAWKQEFGTLPPTPCTFVLVNKKFDKTGSVESLTSSNPGRAPSVDPKYVANFIIETLKKDPTRTNKSIADELGITPYNLERIWKSQGVPTRAFALAEVTQLKTKLAELEKKLQILEGTRKVYKKRRTCEEINAAKSKEAVGRVASTSAKSIQAKKAQFEFPVEAVQQQKQRKSAFSFPQHVVNLDDYGIDDISSDSSSEEEDSVIPSTSEHSVMDLEQVDEEMVDELELHEVSQEEFDQMNEPVSDDDS